MDMWQGFHTFVSLLIMVKIDMGQGFHTLMSLLQFDMKWASSPAMSSIPRGGPRPPAPALAVLQKCFVNFEPVPILDCSGLKNLNNQKTRLKTLPASSDTFRNFNCQKIKLNLLAIEINLWAIEINLWAIEKVLLTADWTTVQMKASDWFE